ncbi:hypothetical protein SK854_11030 [Lentzea sp. BCCO 10_0061]|uniref:Uncharacterized protein n=1 Tax=Lentzea sokolovensis TaxID=3095429 RepID=A0ABU4UV72_9PSEU|nr:hypothetical protein [Lentzea sp. BCCO 10_0061]MDX8142651.1 hypothetical protein [Lentzea sp. BCCO 10_0061]
MDLDDVLAANVPSSGSAGPKGGKREKPPKVKVPWTWAHYAALAVGAFALVCIAYAVLSELVVPS